jgi:uncharacterized damage-inducible protein DinB
MGLATHITELLNKSRGFVHTLAKDIDESNQLHQPVPNGNHCLWILGHLAVTDNGMIGQIDESKQADKEGYWDLFGMGSQPTADADRYPSRQEVEAYLTERRETMLSLVEGLSDEGLAGPTSGFFTAVAPTLGGLLLMAATHDGFHNGQLSVIRRSLGMQPNF